MSDLQKETEEIDKLEKVIGHYLDGHLTDREIQGAIASWGLRRRTDSTDWKARVRVPGGHMVSADLKLMAELSRDFGHGLPVRITARQDLEFEKVAITHLAEFVRRVHKLGLSVKDGGSTGLRNVVAPPDTGLVEEEVFDVMPYARAVGDFFKGVDALEHLPGRVKISFSSRPGEEAAAEYNDIAIYARKRDGKLGFEIHAGGGMGKNRRKASLVEAFVPVEELIPYLVSLLRCYQRLSQDKPRPWLLKNLLDDISPEAFAEEIRKEIKLHPGETPAMNQPAFKVWKGEETDDAEFEDWRSKACRQQIHEGYWLVRIDGDMGSYSPELLQTIAELSESCGQQLIRLTRDKEIMVPWVRDADLKKSFEMLGRPNASRPTVVSCPGQQDCQNCKARPEGLARELLRSEWNDLAPVTIHVSGCANGCGMHQSGALGLEGYRVGENGESGFKLKVGGSRHHVGAVLAESKAAETARALVAWYSRERKGGESFEAFFDRQDESEIEKVLLEHGGQLVES